MDKKKNRLLAWPAVIVTKSTQLMKAFKLFKALKIAKFALTFLTMTLSAVAYSFRYGSWSFAVGFVIMLFIHEMGHVVALRERGYRASLPVFIPFLGALIFAPRFSSSEDEAYAAYAGPLFGTIAAATAFLLWFTGMCPFNSMLLVSFSGALLNLFNLMPVPPLDGGRVTRAVGSWFKWIGMVMLLLLLIAGQDAALLLVFLMAIRELEISPAAKLKVGATCFVVMTVLLALGFTKQHWMISVVDVVIGTVFLLNVLSDVASDHENPTPAVPEVASPNPRRFMWLGLYLALVGVLLALMAAHTPYLAQIVKR